MNVQKVVLAGPRGKMGQEALKMLQREERFELVAVIDRMNDGLRLSHVQGYEAWDVPIYTDLEHCITVEKPDVMLDLTNPETGKKHVAIALHHGVRAVIGTTGFTDEELTHLQGEAAKKGVGCIIAPNFAIGAILMMKFAQMAAKYMPEVEIIELHHPQKLDAPSGTALKTAQMISEVREAKRQGHPNEVELLPGARGGRYEEIPIHSVRLQGLVAHQEVLFGGSGQMLTIRHDSFNRESFMTGVAFALEKVAKLDHLVYGLDQLME